MIWTDGLTEEAKREKRGSWHRWFAWRPVAAGVTNGDRKIMAWLIYIERKVYYTVYREVRNIEYRLIVDKDRP
jgi:hypothetical protein